MTQAAQKILTLAIESLDMLRAVTTVFKESLDKADAWVERLKVIGVQRTASGQIQAPLPSPADILSSPSSPVSASATLPPLALGNSPGSLNFPPPPGSLAQLPLYSPFDGPSSASTTSPPGSGRHLYRDPLPPIALSPLPSAAPSSAPSPSPVSPYSFGQLQLPPLSSVYADKEREVTEGLLNLNNLMVGPPPVGSRAGSRGGSGYATPRSEKGWPSTNDVERERGMEVDN